MSSEPGVLFDQNSGSTTTLCCLIHFYLERERARPLVWLRVRICIRGTCAFHLNMPFKSYPVKETFDSRQNYCLKHNRIIFSLLPAFFQGLQHPVIGGL